MFAIMLSSLCLANDFTVDRPTVGTSASTIGKQMLQLETGIHINTISPSSASIPTLIRYGVTPSTELRMFSGVIQLSDEPGYEPLGIELKQTILQKEQIVLGAVTNGIVSFDGNPLTLSAIALLDYSAKPWSLWFNIGTIANNPSNLSFETVFALGAGINVTDTLQVCVEQSGTIADAFSGYAQISLLHSSNDNQWDVYYQGSSHNLSEHIVGLGYAKRWSVNSK